MGLVSRVTNSELGFVHTWLLPVLPVLQTRCMNTAEVNRWKVLCYNAQAAPVRYYGDSILTGESVGELHYEVVLLILCIPV